MHQAMASRRHAFGVLNTFVKMLAAVGIVQGFVPAASPAARGTVAPAFRHVARQRAEGPLASALRKRDTSTARVFVRAEPEEQEGEPRSPVTSIAAPVAPPVAVQVGVPKEPQKMKFGETTTRSLAKAFGWRVTAAIITLASGLLFAKNLSVAATIVGSDFITKSGFMFLGERVWNKVKWGQSGTGDSSQRSLAKALLWRVFAAANTLVCSAFLSGDLSVASKIAGMDTIVKTGFFYVNERIWNAVEWGKEYEVEYNI